MKKYRTAIIIFIVVVIILLLIVLFWNKIFPPKDEKQEQQESHQEATQSNVSITLQEGSFPLTIKDKNLKVQRVQQALIKMGCSIPAGPTGYFGSQTQAALKCAGYDDSKITESDYNDILAGKKKQASITPTKIKGLYAKYDNVIVRNKDLSQNRVAFKDQWIGKPTGEDSSYKYWEVDGQYYVIKTSSYLV